MPIPPTKAEMKRGANGPAPVRRNLLWDSTRARQQGQKGHDVAARDGKRGEIVPVTGMLTGEQFVRGVRALHGARNRAACRQGHVCQRKYLAARAAGETLPAPVVIVSPRFEVRLDRAVEAAPEPVHHSGSDAIAAILEVHRKCTEV